MSDNVVAIDQQSKILHEVVAYLEWLRDEVRANRVSCLTIRGVTEVGDVIQYDIVPVNAPTVRYVMIGQVEEAKQQLLAIEDE